MKQFKKIFLAASSAALLTMTGSAFAGQAPSSGQVITLALTNSCTIAAPAAVTFTSQLAGSTLAAPLVATAGTAVATCTGAGSIKVGVDSGTNGTTTQRNLKGTGAALIKYTINTGGSAIGTDTLNPVPGLPFSAAPVSIASSTVGANNVPITVSVDAQTLPTVVDTYTSTVTYYVDF
jgi:hypothetical protein